MPALNRISLVSTILALSFATSSADRIVFVDGMELEGTVVKQGEIDMTVRVEYGKVRLLRSRVDRVELDINARLQELQEGEAPDTQSYLTLAKLCEDYNHEEGLIKCLECAAEKEDMPPDKLIQLASLYEKRGMKEQYKNVLYRYMELNPGRTDVRDKLDKLEGEAQKAEEERLKREEEEARKLAEEQEKRLQELEAKEKEEMAGRRETITEYFKERELTPEMIAKKEKEEPEAPGELPEDVLGKAPEEKPEKAPQDDPEKAPAKEPEEPEKIAKKDDGAGGTGETKVVGEGGEKKTEEPKDERPQADEGLEADKRWKVQNWGNPAKLEIIDQGGETKNMLVQLAFTKTDKDKAAIGLDCPTDLSAAEEIQFDAFNGSQSPISIAIAIQTMPGWTYYESYATTIKPNKWAVKKSISINNKRFKSAESNWNYASEIKNLKNTVKLYFLVYHSVAQGSIFLDNVKFHPEPEPEKAEEQPPAE